MLIKITVENFKSFEQATEMTMVSSSKIRKKDDHKRQIKSTNLLKHAVIYGANASGKTNLVEFFAFFKFVLEAGLTSKTSRLFCRNKKENESRESLFELQFTVGEKFYAYGFSAILSQREIVSEWLYELYQTGSSKCLFERDAKSNLPINTSLGLTKEEKSRLYMYANDFLENRTSLFLSEMNRNKKIDSTSNLSIYKTVYNYLTNNIKVFSPDDPITDFKLYYNDQSLATINELIKSFDTGIGQIKVQEVGINELKEELPEPIYKDLLDTINSKYKSSIKKLIRISMRSNDSFFNIEVDENSVIKITTIRFDHIGSDYQFDFEDESDGTRRLFDLIDILLSDDDMIFIIDELERSLHPKMTQRFLELFDQAHKEKNTQLIFTTHESSIMDQKLFRRDEIWFVERNKDNSSVLYPLDKFKERYDKTLSKAYLEGRYGAIPIFTDFVFKED